MKSGIYKITNITTGDIYIGSSSRLETRKKEHILAANSGRHHSIIFQRAWDKYGSESFEFENLELCPNEQLLEREQYYIDLLKPKYNISPIAGAPTPPPNKPILRICMVSGDEKIYNTRDEASAEGFNEGEITACCLGRAGSHKGYYWTFVEENSKEFNYKTRIIPIRRINPKTKEEKIYPSMTAASKDGFSISGISACYLGKQNTHKGYYWLGINESLDEKTKAKEIGLLKYDRNDQFTRIDPKTNEFKIYSSTKEIIKDGFNLGHVRETCKGIRNHHKGYIWRSGKQTDLSIDDAFMKKDKTKIVRTHIKTGEKKIYESLVEVKKDGFSNGNVHMCCNGLRGSHKGYKWQYLDLPIQFKSKVKKILGTNITTGEKIYYDTKAATSKDGFSPAKVGACCLGRRKSHKGYTWEEIGE